ncbi:MAG: hypothetical protein AB7P40_32180 [Chloroflexota bacterium]
MSDQPAQTPSQSAVTPATPRGGSDRFLLAIVIGAVLLIVLGVAVVLLNRKPAATPPADPASVNGVVQRYVEAMRAGDLDTARSLMTSEARADSQSRDGQNPYRASADDNVRIIVETASQTETTAEAKVTISRFYARSDPFSSNTSHRTVTVKLLREDGEWRVSLPTSPYSFS